MKIEALKRIIKETVKEAFQEEVKELLYEQFKSGAKPQVNPISQMVPPPMETKAPPMDRQALREEYRNVLGATAANFNTSQVAQPLQVTTTDTASPNGRLPDGEVSMDQIMGIMNK